MSTKNMPVVAGVEIRSDAENRYSLNALHQASGGNEKHKPDNWLRLDTTQAYIAAVEKESGKAAVSVARGRNGGTFACRDVIIEYAGWISPEFRLQVNRTFAAVIDGNIEKAYTEAEKAKLALYRGILDNPNATEGQKENAKYLTAFIQGDADTTASIEAEWEAKRTWRETTMEGQVDAQMPPGPGYQTTIKVPDYIEGTRDQVLAEMNAVAKKRKYKFQILDEGGRNFLIESK